MKKKLLIVAGIVGGVLSTGCGNRKMTLAEIEEKLGYKVELVSEKEEKTND